MAAIPDTAYTPPYVSPAGDVDEMCTNTGQVREHWKYLMSALQALGPSELETRRLSAQRQLREDGVTYNVYGDPDGLHRPWALDPIPLLISSEEWAVIEAGLLQRAELLSLILGDLYGPRKLIRKRLLPPELLYNHEGFLRPCDRIRLPGPHQLVVYAADMARGPDHHMWVLEDRTQAPSGAGYALENRVIMSRTLPSLFRDSHVHRLALFFQALRASLAGLAPDAKEDPRIVVWTPGPRNETYFEHAYLASYLGYTLVEGADLTVRRGKVWLRSLRGLEPVDVILRRVDDHYCDALELKPDSELGVPGLVEAARRGNVAIVNPLGSNVLENPGLLPFLPAIAKYFLGQPLRLPTVATWWCGQPQEREYVLANLRQLVIKPIHRNASNTSVYGAFLSNEQLTQWRARIQARPHLYVGQEPVSFSSAPTLVDGLLAPRPTLLRAFLVARNDGYVAMPGGLTRVAPKADVFLISNQTGAIAKDTWVLASEPVKQVSLWLTNEHGARELESEGSLPSRAAESLFWVGRYAERAEDVIRLLRTVLDRLGALASDSADAECLQCLLQALTHLTATYPGFLGGSTQSVIEPKLLTVIGDANQSGSLSSSLRQLIQAAWSVRDLLSSDTWQVVNDLEEDWRALQTTGIRDLSSARSLLAPFMKSLLALAGLATESMARGPGWRFMDIGRRLERGLAVISLIRSMVAPVRRESVESLILEAVLATTESLVTYRRRHRSRLNIDTVLELLLQDEENPRSLGHQLEQLSNQIAALPRSRVSAGLSQEERLVLEASTLLRLADTPRLAVAQPNSWVRYELDQLMARVGHLLAETADALSGSYCTHVERPRQLVGTTP